MDMKLSEDVWHFVKSLCDYSASVIKGNDAIYLPPQGGSCWGCLRAYLLPFCLMKRGLEWLEMVFERDAVRWVSIRCLREEWHGLKRAEGSIFCMFLRYQLGMKLLYLKYQRNNCDRLGTCQDVNATCPPSAEYLQQTHFPHSCTALRLPPPAAEHSTSLCWSLGTAQGCGEALSTAWHEEGG